MAHSKGDWMGQTLIECDYGAGRVQFKYPDDVMDLKLIDVINVSYVL